MGGKIYAQVKQECTVLDLIPYGSPLILHVTGIFSHKIQANNEEIMRLENVCLIFVAFGCFS